MDGNIEILNFIHQNAQMCVETFEQRLEITKDSSFKELKQKKTI